MHTKTERRDPRGPLQDVPLSTAFSPARHWTVPLGISVHVTIWWLRHFVQLGVKNDVLG